MARPSEATIKRLYLLTSNRCAFPDCNHLLVDGKDNSIAEACHICGNKLGAPRYDADQTEEQRQSADNLIVLCANHHTTIDGDPVTYTVDVLRDVKRRHEAKATKEFIISDRTARDIAFALGSVATASLLGQVAQVLGTIFGTIGSTTKQPEVKDTLRPKVTPTPKVSPRTQWRHQRPWSPSAFSPPTKSSIPGIKTPWSQKGWRILSVNLGEFEVIDRSLFGDGIRKFEQRSIQRQEAMLNRFLSRCRPGENGTWLFTCSGLTFRLRVNEEELVIIILSVEQLDVTLQ